jgi:hypothetical protein
MSVNKSEILVPSRAYVWLGAVGAAAPTDVTTAPATGWRNVGLTTGDSLAFATAPEFQEVTSHQSDFPVRRFQTSDSATVSVDLQQFSAPNFKAVYGGGSVVEVGSASGIFKFTPPRLGERQEVAAMIEVIDGTKHYRWVFPRALQIEGVSAELQKGQEGRLPLRLTVLGDDVADAWYLLTDDPSFDPAP